MGLVSNRVETTALSGFEMACGFHFPLISLYYRYCMGFLSYGFLVCNFFFWLRVDTVFNRRLCVLQGGLETALTKSSHMSYIFDPSLIRFTLESLLQARSLV